MLMTCMTSSWLTKGSPCYLADESEVPLDNLGAKAFADGMATQALAMARWPTPSLGPLAKRGPSPVFGLRQAKLPVESAAAAPRQGLLRYSARRARPRLRP
jgi:hypothetical protein